MNNDFFKRLLDISVAITLFVIFLPIWVIVPILIYLESGSPIIFKHKRIGKDGKEFHIYKFRSMVLNADEFLHTQDPELLKQFKANDWKMDMEKDPRITKLGKVLRSLTIDEFPQLYNVLRGEMSMVGPRAYVKRELDEQTERYPETRQYKEQILSVRPGITGPWQTSGRNSIPFPQRAAMDADYAKNHTVFRDISILLKTPKAMLSKW